MNTTHLLGAAIIGVVGAIVGALLWWLADAPSSTTLVPFLFAALAIVLQHRTIQTLTAQVGELSRKNMALSERPPAQQLATFEGQQELAREFHRQNQPASTNERQARAPLHS